MIIGFIGTGTITTSVVRGLLNTGSDVERIWVSPRNAERASALADEFQQVAIASSNQVVIDSSDLICLAIRPQIFEEVLAPLQFRDGVPVVSFVATWPLEEVRRCVIPATEVFRMVPLPSVERGEGPIALYPRDENVEATFQNVGTVVPVDSEDDLHSLWAVTAMMAPYFSLLDNFSSWLRGRGLSGKQSDVFVSSFFAALGETSRSACGAGFEPLSIEHATEGGLNEQLRRELAARDWFGQPKRGLDLILDRLEGRATLADKLK